MRSGPISTALATSPAMLTCRRSSSPTASSSCWSIPGSAGGCRRRARSAAPCRSTTPARAGRGIGHDTSAVFHYRGAEIRAALDALRDEAGDPHEGITLRFANPATGASVFPTLDYGAQLLRSGETTGWKRETANAFYIVLDGEGTTEIAGHQFDWQTNDLFVVPNFLWRRPINP